MLRPKEIQARIRAGASVEQVAQRRASTSSRVERFAHPVLLERSRAAELATAAHPVLADGPAVLTLLETVTTALIARGLDPDATNWDAWRNEDGRWTVQLSWKAGLSDNIAHFRFTPGAHGGTVTAFDDAAMRADRSRFRPAAAAGGTVATRSRSSSKSRRRPATRRATPAPAGTKPPAAPKRPRRKGKPPVPAWEDVLLGRALQRPALDRSPRQGPSDGQTTGGATPSATGSDAIPNARQHGSHAPATPTGQHEPPQHRWLRHPHTVGARPPTATRLSPTASSG